MQEIKQARKKESKIERKNASKQDNKKKNDIKGKKNWMAEHRRLMNSFVLVTNPSVIDEC